ncbi:hypothetical protein [Polyangium fumosum]|uniref:Outer membrane protein beta-barrel domain-containing protein n=1 Tax=Polyangium fumosum TaxID=889272 RepID=A0A4U1J9X2_9BACT|nr:hypothetical protein [Polyangium fumosum]TKD05211.1 hypothetical protein E8A74_22005 [Polyangium fumosum]
MHPPTARPKLRLFALALALCALGLGGCGGGAPLLHPAHVLSPGKVTLGAGLSGRPVLAALPSAPGTEEALAESVLQDRTVAPAVAPWVGGRVGIAGANEAGLTYSGRAVRLDGRHAFALSKSVALSMGLGGELILSGRPSEGKDAGSLLGGGLDVPLLIGWKSTGELYSGWIGPRAGVSWVRGTYPSADLDKPTTLAGEHVRVGMVAGLRLGFRHVHVAVEIGGDWHAVSGRLGATDVSFNQFSLTPAGALILGF